MVRRCCFIGPHRRGATFTGQQYTRWEPPVGWEAGVFVASRTCQDGAGGCSRVLPFDRYAVVPGRPGTCSGASVAVAVVGRTSASASGSTAPVPDRVATCGPEERITTGRPAGGHVAPRRPRSSSPADLPPQLPWWRTHGLPQSRPVAGRSGHRRARSGVERGRPGRAARAAAPSVGAVPRGRPGAVRR